VGHEAPIGQPTEAVDGPFSFEAGFAGLEERGGRLGRLVAQYFERDQERKKIGRALVEERARNLEAARVRHELETRIQTIEGEASRARHEAESRVRTSDARLAEAKNELDAARQELKLTEDRHLALQLRLRDKDEEAFSAKQRLEWADAEALRQAETLRATLANLKRNVAAARARIESLHASRALKAVRLVSGAPFSTAEKAAAELASAEQDLAQIELISKAMLQRASEPVPAAPNGASEQASAVPTTRGGAFATLSGD
jgi:hypothetical protein